MTRKGYYNRELKNWSLGPSERQETYGKKEEGGIILGNVWGG